MVTSLTSSYSSIIPPAVIWLHMYDCMCTWLIGEVTWRSMHTQYYIIWLKSVVGEDHSHFGTQISVFEWKLGSHISLFKPLLLNLFNVHSQHIQRYLCLTKLSWLGAWVNLIFLYSWFCDLGFRIWDLGPLFRCSNIYSTCDAPSSVGHICSTTRSCAHDKVNNFFLFLQLKNCLGCGRFMFKSCAFWFWFQAYCTCMAAAPG